MIGLYHLAIYFIRKKDLATLYIGLLAIDASLCVFDGNVYLLGLLGYLLYVMILGQMYPKESNRLVMTISHVATGLFVLYLLIVPTDVYTRTWSLQLAVIIAFSLCTIFYVSLFALIRHKAGAAMQLVIYLLIVAASLNMAFISPQTTQSMALFYGVLFVCVLLQAICVANQYSNLMEASVKIRTSDLHLKNDQLAEMHRSRTEMMANISHDIGSPLSGIQMNIKLLNDGLVPDHQRPELMQTLLDKVAYIKQLNDDLFELSMLSSGHFHFHYKKFELRSFIEDLIHQLAADLDSRNIRLRIVRLETTIGEDEAWVQADAMKLTQVIHNYVGNAIKFSRQTNPVIELNCCIRHEEEDGVEQPYEVMVEVVDHGSGIDEEDLPHVFDRFFHRVEGNAYGSGLGLAIAKEIIDQHHGHVAATSQIGLGSRFSFVLPVFTVK